LILEGGLAGLGNLDFVVERLEFLVGLDRGLVLLELGHAHVDGGHFFLEGPAGRGVLVDFGPHLVHGRLRRRDGRVERTLGRRYFTDSLAGRIRGRIERLEGNKGGQGLKHAERPYYRRFEI
jgi:hypothetical protein